MPDPSQTKPDSNGMILHACIELGDGPDGRRSDLDRVQRMRSPNSGSLDRKSNV